MKDKKSFIIVFCFFILSFFLISYSEKNISEKYIKNVKIAGQSVRVDLALTNEEKMQGLSGRESLDGDKGMLFIFDKPSKYFFWMKGMNFSIDIVWINEDMNVVYIKKDAKPENFLDTYGPEIDSKYVLELVSGFSDKNNLKIGDKVEFGY